MVFHDLIYGNIANVIIFMHHNVSRTNDFLPRNIRVAFPRGIGNFSRGCTHSYQLKNNRSHSSKIMSFSHVLMLADICKSIKDMMQIKCVPAHTSNNGIASLSIFSLM